MNLTDDAIFEILTRLPAKSLLRFRSVCKSWYNLTYNSAFIESHLNKSIESDSINLLIATYSSPEPTKLHYSNIFELPHLYFWRTKLVGSCNGIVCIIRGKCIWLFNPYTRECKCVHFDNTFDLDKKIGNYGFGYNPNDGDYNLVRVLNSANHSDIHVYSLKDASHFTISGIPCTVLDDSAMGIYFNGALHWAAKSKRTVDILVFAFDIKEKVFREIPGPCGVDGIRDPTIRVLGGELCLILWNYLTFDLEVWSMKVYGVRGSWDKIFSMPSETRKVASSRPLCYCNSRSEVLVHSEKSLFSYDPKRKTVGRVKFPAETLHRNSKILTYVPSLVSLNTGTYLTNAFGLKASKNEDNTHPTLARRCMEKINMDFITHPTLVHRCSEEIDMNITFLFERIGGMKGAPFSTAEDLHVLSAVIGDWIL